MKLFRFLRYFLIVSIASCLDMTGVKDIAYYNYVGEVTTFFVEEPVKVTSRNQEIVSVDGSASPSDLNALVFNNLVIQFLPKGIGKFFPNLILLHVTNSQLKEISRFDLAALPQLISLDLEGNELKYLPGDLFLHNFEVQEVNFRNNKLSEIGEDIFATLDGLQSINLEDNECISMAAANVPDILNFIKLECPSPRDLRKKYCSNDTDSLSTQNLALRKEIEGLRSELLNLKLKFDSCDGNLDSATKTLLEQQKKIQACSKTEELKLPQKINVVCEVNENHFEAVDLKIDSKVMEIQDTVNKTGDKLDGKVCEFLAVRHQQTLHLPMNIGEKFMNLKHFEVSFSGLFEIDEKSFEKMENLESLNLTENKLREIPAKSFESLTGLKSLDLSFNKIEALDSKVFTALGSLKTLNLEQNLLDSVGGGIFDNLKGLQTLNLSHNKLKVVCAYLFLDQAELKVVDFSKNVCIDKKYSTINLKEIEADIIDHCIAPIEIRCKDDHENKSSCEVVELNISYPKTKISAVYQNNMENFQSFSVVNQSMLFMPFELAQKFPNLTEILIERSKLSILQKYDFDGLHGLTKIVITFNNITSIENGTFDGLQKLENLNLASNNIHALPHKVFFFLAELKTLDISGNQLKRLPANILRPKNFIKDFNAAGNQLEFVETKILRYLKAAQQINLTGNACINLRYEKTSNRSSRALVELSGEIDLYCSEDSVEAFDA